MTREFLDSLVGLPEDIARNRCEEAGLMPWVCEPGVARAMMAIADTVAIDVDASGTVVRAESCDP